jgi:hypothetical protein
MVILRGALLVEQTGQQIASGFESSIQVWLLHNLVHICPFFCVHLHVYAEGWFQYLFSASEDVMLFNLVLDATAQLLVWLCEV